MSTQIHLIYVLLALVGTSTFAWGNPTHHLKEKASAVDVLPFPYFETAEVFTCGGLLTEASDQILYKPFRQVDANERCVWVVAAPRAGSYQVRVLHYGYEPEERLINVAGVSVVSSEPVSNTSPVNSGNVTVSGSVLVITFHTPANVSNSNGFALEYSVTSNSSYISPNSRQSIVGPDTIFAKYPEGRNQYDNYELGTFVIPPLNNVFVEGRSRQVIYKRIQLEVCYDKLSIYNFDPAQNRYVLRGSLCDRVDTELISNDDVSLLVFRSDSSVLGEGFNLAFANCGGS